MIALALSLSLGLAGPDPCAGVLDRTGDCAAPDEVPAAVSADPRQEGPALALPDVIASDEIPPKLGLFAAALAIGGTAAVSMSYAVTPPGETADEERLRKAVRLGGVSVLAVAGLVGGSAMALSFFDPATGVPRHPLEDAE